MSVRWRHSDVIPVKQTHLVVEERRLANLIFFHDIHINPLLRRHELPPTTRPPTVHSSQELSHELSIIADHPLHNAILTTELKLVAKIRQLTLCQRFRRSERLRSGRVGRRNAEDRGDELGVPLCDTVDGRSTPVMTTEDELGRVGLACNGGDGVGVGAEAVVV